MNQYYLLSLCFVGLIVRIIPAILVYHQSQYGDKNLMMKKYLVMLLSLLTLISAQLRADDPLTLDWLDLIPKKERNIAQFQPPPVISHNGDMPVRQTKLGSTREDLNNSLVRIPGFVIPLEGDDKVTTEFLLVPYFGACIHVPPPPPNQIVYVKFKKGAPLTELWDVVNVIGVLKTTVIDHDLGQAGYLMEGIRLEPYEDEEIDEYEPS